jgi:hypothetical protein
MALLLGSIDRLGRINRNNLKARIIAWGVIGITILMGLTLTIGVFLGLRQNSLEALERQFQFVSAERASAVIEKFRDNLRDLDSVRRFYQGAKVVNRLEFRQFVVPILQYRGFQALE